MILLLNFLVPGSNSLHIVGKIIRQWGRVTVCTVDTEFEVVSLLVVPAYVDVFIINDVVRNERLVFLIAYVCIYFTLCG